MSNKSPQRKFTRIWTAAREAADMTIEDVARKAGINKVTVYRALDSNGDTLKVVTLERLCRAVGLQPQECWK